MAVWEPYRSSPRRARALLRRLWDGGRALLFLGGLSLRLGLVSAGLGPDARQQCVGPPQPRPAGGESVPGALQRFHRALFDRSGGDAGRTSEPVEVSLQDVGPQLTLVGMLFTVVGQALAFVGQALAFVGDAFTLVSQAVALIGDAFAFVGVALPLCDPLFARIELLHPSLVGAAGLTRVHMTSMRSMTTLVTRL